MSSTIDILDISYHKWCKIKSILNKLSDPQKTQLERFSMGASIVGDYAEKTNNFQHFHKFEKDFKDSNKSIKESFEMINSIRKSPELPEFRVKLNVTFHDSLYIYSIVDENGEELEFFTVSHKRISYLLKKFAKDGVSMGTVDRYIAACLLQYSFFGDLKRHLCFSSEYVQSLQKDGYTVEAFASPFAFQLGLFDDNAIFCSAIPETDLLLGSKGSFTSADINYSGLKTYVHPPRIVEINDTIFAKILNELNSTKCEFTIILYNDTPMNAVMEFFANFLKKVQKLQVYSENPFTDAVMKSEMKCWAYTVSSL